MEYTDGADNMPENLQYGEQAESMREMGMSLETQADELENLDFDPPYELDDEPEEPEASEFDADDDYEAALDEWEMKHSDWFDEKSENESHLETLKEDAQSASDEVEFLF